MSHIQQDSPLYYSPKTIGKLLDISPQAIRNWVYEGKLPAIWIGKALRISKDHFHQLIQTAELECPTSHLDKEYISFPNNAALKGRN